MSLPSYPFVPLFVWCVFVHIKNGCTALMKASQEGRTAIVRVLLKAGADKDAKDKVRESIYINIFNW